MSNKKPVHYVNNQDLLAAIMKYKEDCAAWRAAGNEGRPQTKEYQYIGKCILQIAKKLSNSPNFIGYTFKEEMVNDGIIDCVRGLENFDPEKSKNPFAYLTQMCYYAALRRIGGEKKQTEIKRSLILNSGITNDLANYQNSDDAEQTSQLGSFLMDYLGNAPKEVDPNAPKMPKRTTKAYQAKMKELERKEKEFVDITRGEEPEEGESDPNDLFDELGFEE